jgi:uncharacterized protein YecE (DUF72 family)
MLSGHTYIGTSGWHYTAWRDDFYHGLPEHQWLSFYCRHFNSVEINASFYRLQTRETYRHWHDATPANFHFSLKGSRFLTHYKKLVDPLPSIRLERDRAQELGKKLAVVLWQLPASLSKNLTHLDQFVKALTAWPEVRHAIEFRHYSWFDEEVATCLHTYRIAVCQSDSADWPMWHTVTADMVYVRLHGNKTTYVSSYDTRELLCWAQRVNGWLEEDKDVYVYFDNDAQGAAPLNARTLTTIMLPT